MTAKDNGAGEKRKKKYVWGNFFYNGIFIEWWIALELFDCSKDVQSENLKIMFITLIGYETVHL
jgi:hypothetical protein